jgi:hypothetical protein
MSRHGIAAAFFGLSLALAPLSARAGVGVHLEASIEHVQEAIETGAKKHPKDMLDHVRSALGHAREALHEQAVEGDREANKLLHRAIRHLRQAEMRARFGDSTSAVKHSADALAELKKVK